jgi:hypothetical protein
MEELIRTPFVREVAAVCVDPSPSRPPLPPWLKSVPALVIMGESSPRVGPGPVNNWLFERRMSGSAHVASANVASAPKNSVSFDNRRLAAPVYSVDAVSRPDTSSRVVPTSRSDVSVASNGRLPAAISANVEGDKNASPPTLVGSADDSKVSAYHTLEMSDKKWSDIYSFLAARPHDSADKTFELLASAMGETVGGSSGDSRPPAARVSEKEAALLREFEAYTAGRDREVKGPVMRR